MARKTDKSVQYKKKGREREYMQEYMRELRKLTRKSDQRCNERAKARRAKTLAQLVERMGDKCLICGQQYPHEVYDFHHLNPQEKSGLVSQMIPKGLVVAWREARKCVLVCANCHRQIHSGKVTISRETKAA